LMLTYARYPMRKSSNTLNGSSANIVAEEGLTSEEAEDGVLEDDALEFLIHALDDVVALPGLEIDEARVAGVYAERWREEGRFSERTMFRGG